jgi:hypothetical protein
LATLIAAGGVVSGCGGGVNPYTLASGTSGGSVVAAVSNGPQMGYLWNTGDASLRPILGVPGSAQFGQAVTPAGQYINGAASVQSELALLQGADGSVSVQALPDGTPSAIAGVSFKGAAQIVFSPSGNNAVLYTPGGSSAILLTSLGAAPQLQTLVPPPNLLAAAVSDSAQVASVSGPGPLTAQLLTGSRTTLASLTTLGGVSFLPGGSDLLLADGSTGVINLVRNAASAPTSQTFSLPAAVHAPVAVASSRDGQFAVVANGDGSVGRIDLSGATAALRIPCSCQPSQLVALTGNAVFSLTPAGSSNWAVDASALVPRTVFIPALQAVKP